MDVLTKPWLVGLSSPGAAVHKAHFYVFKVHPDYPVPIKHVFDPSHDVEVARRVALCVNALAGVPTAELERLTGANTDLLKRVMSETRHRTLRVRAKTTETTA